VHRADVSTDFPSRLRSLDNDFKLVAMDPSEFFSGDIRIATRRQLMRLGMSPVDLTEGVRVGRLLRVRRDRYALPTTPPAILEAVRIGGLLSCVSAADFHGIWVPDEPFTHIAMAHQASRMRSPRDRFVRLSVDNRDGCELHWWPLAEPDAASLHSVTVVDSLVHIVRCQPRPVAAAALDSALFEGKVKPSDLGRIFDAVPAKFAHLRDDIDARSMSGLETITRLMVRDAGLHCDLQVHFRGVGDVDLLVEGCVVVETDGRNGHEGKVGQRRDYDRDVILAALGLTVLRFNYRQVMYHPGQVMAAIVGALRAHRRGPVWL
jgi:very-short-patch-repair endonuclease